MKALFVFALALCGAQSVKDNSASDNSDQKKTKRHYIDGYWNYPWNYQPEGYFYPQLQHPQLPPLEQNIGNEIHLSTINLTPVILIDKNKRTIKVNFAAEVESSKSFIVLPFEEVISAPLFKEGTQTLSFDLVLNHNYRNGLTIAPKVTIKANKTEELEINEGGNKNEELNRNKESKIDDRTIDSGEENFDMDTTNNSTDSDDYFPKIDVRGFEKLLDNKTNESLLK